MHGKSGQGEDNLAFLDNVRGSHIDRGHRAVAFGINESIHFHGLDSRELGTRDHLLPDLAVDGDNASGQRTRDSAGSGWR
jgi:hypothetical protein